MAAKVDAHLADGRPLGTHSKQCRSILVHLLAVAILVDSLNLVGLEDRRLVFHANLRLKLILSCKVELIVQLVVYANDGGNTHARLVAEQVDTVGILRQTQQLATLLHGREFLNGASQLGFLSRESHAGSLFLCQHPVNLRGHGHDFAHLLADAGQECAEVEVAPLRAHLYIANAGLVGGIAVEQAQAAIDRQVVSHLICCTELETIIILPALHIAIHVVAHYAIVGNGSAGQSVERAGKTVQIHKGGSYFTHLALERTQTAFKLTFAAAAGN